MQTAASDSVSALFDAALARHRVPQPYRPDVAEARADLRHALGERWATYPAELEGVENDLEALAGIMGRYTAELTAWAKSANTMVASPVKDAKRFGRVLFETVADELELTGEGMNLVEAHAREAAASVGERA